MNVFPHMLSRRWILTTLLVIAACGVMVRLGIWQLDRLEKRRAFNTRVLEQQAAPQFELDQATFDLDLYEMEYRAVRVQGVYDHSQEVVLRNQVHDRRPGYRLLTPLHIEGTGATILVDRGFVPSEEYTPGDWETYATDGSVDVYGVIRRAQSAPDFGSRSDPTPQPGERLSVWNLANVAQMARQMPYDLLPVYVQETPRDGDTPENGTYPMPLAPELELTEGPHLGYAIQWFLFASVLGIGYPFFIRNETQRHGSEEG